jgi:hypothetical protein
LVSVGAEIVTSLTAQQRLCAVLDRTTAGKAPGPKINRELAHHPATPGQELARRPRHVARMQARVFNRIFWRAQAQNSILRGLSALESGVFEDVRGHWIVTQWL